VAAARGVEAPAATGRECLDVLRAVFGLYAASRTGQAQTLG
jgi:hypothetical protein